jgi:ABC-type bacteriocin/lantibiotic exporter with double-glycine peptidase domain
LANEKEKKFGEMVLQESILFHGTIEENLLMGREVAEEDLLEAIEISDLNEFIHRFPLKMHTILSEEGKNISGGQRQRFSICRSILGNPKIILLDEPTSAPGQQHLLFFIKPQ